MGICDKKGIPLDVKFALSLATKFVKLRHNNYDLSVNITYKVTFSSGLYGAVIQRQEAIDIYNNSVF